MSLETKILKLCLKYENVAKPVNKGACSLAQLLVFDIIKQKNKNFWTFETTTAAS